jgi:hypothetical protein
VEGDYGCLRQGATSFSFQKNKKMSKKTCLFLLLTLFFLFLNYNKDIQVKLHKNLLKRRQKIMRKELKTNGTKIWGKKWRKVMAVGLGVVGGLVMTSISPHAAPEILTSTPNDYGLHFTIPSCNSNTLVRVYNPDETPDYNYNYKNLQSILDIYSGWSPTEDKIILISDEGVGSYQTTLSRAKYQIHFSNKIYFHSRTPEAVPQPQPAEPIELPDAVPDANPSPTKLTRFQRETYKLVDSGWN